MTDNARVAPVAGVPAKQRPWEGTLARRPWEYPATAAVVHRDTPEMLAGVVALLRAQDVAPYLVVVDTGSGPEGQAYLADLDRGDDVEVHYLRSKGWRCSSQPVAAAMDLAFAVCQTEVLFATHTDVFPTRPDLVGHLVSLCDARTPVVGWQMSPRDGWPDDSWRETPSHTASAYHMPTMRALGATWNMLRAFEALGQPHGQTRGGYPDTETCLGLTLAAHGITRRDAGAPDDTPDDGGRHWLCLGPEPNEPYETRWFRHYRATGSVTVYFPNEFITRVRQHQVGHELAEVPARVEQWRQSRDGQPDA